MDVVICRDPPIHAPVSPMSLKGGKSRCLRRDGEEVVDSDQSKSINKKETTSASDQNDSIQEYRMTEAIVPPFATPTLSTFTTHHYPTYGTGILLVTPTLNTFKTKLLKETFTRKAPRGHAVHTISVAFNSGVGEQPYNSAGFEGAHNRITNALRYLDDPANQAIFREHQIGTVIVAAIENFIQTEDPCTSPTDFGVVVLHNATNGKTVSCLSQGVTVPQIYVDQARRLGFEGDVNYGKVSVGKVFAEHVPGIDHANWHQVVSGRSRYDILTEAVQGLQIPW